jgi:Short C-terminal domain
MSSLWSVILAQAERALGTWKSPVLWTTLSLVAVLLLGAVVLFFVDRWRKRSRQDRPDTGDQLSHFRSLYDRGELSREEFEQIRAKLGAKLKQEMKIPAKSDAAETTEPSAPPAAPASPEKPSTEPPQPPEPPANGTPNA